MGTVGTEMLRNLPDTINSFSSFSKTTVTSLIKNMKVNKIERDRKFWNEVVLVELRKYFGVLLKIIMNVGLMTEYMSLSENEQNEFIKKLIRGG